MKTCSKCGVEKDISFFVKNKGCKDGTENRCLFCYKKYIEKYRSKNKNRINKYHKQYRAKNQSRVREIHKKYRRSESARKLANIRNKGLREKYPEKFKARAKLNYAIKMGRITRLPCSICGNEKSEAHHEDYSKPLDVVWLCRKHHYEHHSLSKTEK